MRILSSSGRDDLARVFIGEFAPGRRVEFVESLQPPLPREEKWVLIVSTLCGCPVGCPFCDAGGDYQGRLSAGEILAQIDHLVRRRYPAGRIPAGKFKIQFARMGEPALNPAVLAVLRELPRRYDAPGLLPALSTIAPRRSERFFAELAELKRRHYRGRFQLQFSLHSTDAAVRRKLIPYPHWDLSEIADFGRRFRDADDRRITLNFALARGIPIEAHTLRRHFDPRDFVIKITPVNPTHRARAHAIESFIDPQRPSERDPLLQSLRAAGYDLLLSIGEVDENRIGSNCGQYLQAHMRSRRRLAGAYGDAVEWTDAAAAR
ncbi:MAG: radical SAM protein [Candidatus Eisenbacteria bacterium]|nr:radical SAM protein [Candidatus Eisenbacteria bacterium]